MSNLTLCLYFVKIYRKRGEIEIHGQFLCLILCYLFYMVAQNMMRTYGVNQVFRFVEAILLHRVKSDFFFGKGPILQHTCATCSELLYHKRTMV